MDKIIYNVASYKRPDTLLKTIESIYNQSDIINVALNDYSEIHKDLYDTKINLFITDNDKGDAYKFYSLPNSNGYFLTIDDDLIYGKNYSDYMVDKIEQYKRKSIVTTHGRYFDSFPINSYYNKATTVLHFKNKLDYDTKVQFGGTGVMGFHTDLFKIDMNYFKYPNMADIWIGKYAKENNIDIICVNHSSELVKQQKYEDSIYSSDLKNDKIQTNIVNSCYSNKEISIIIPTYNNIDYIDECIQSVVLSSNDFSYEVLIGIDKCDKTLEYIKNKEYGGNVRFFYFTKNVGPYTIKNTLAKLSNGDKLLFFDSDDIMLPDMVKQILDLQKNCDFVKPMLLNFKDGENPYYLNTKPTNQYGEGVFSIRRELFLSMNGFEGWRCAADSDFMGRLYKNNKSFKYTPKIVFYRRVHDKSLTQQSDTNMTSSLRAKYVKMSKSKTNFGPLPKLVTESNYEIFKDKIEPIILSDEQIIQDKIDTLLNDVIKLNVKKVKEPSKIDYNTINSVLSKNDVYIPSKNVKPLIENKPINRNELFELKKGTIAHLNNEFFPQKRKRDDSNNPFSKKNRH